MFFGGDKGSYITVKEETVNEEIRSVDLDWVSGNLTVYKSEDEKTRVVQKGYENFPEEQTFEVSAAGGRLTVRDRRGRGWNFFSFGVRRGDLEVYLPEKQYESFSSSGASSSVLIEEFKADSMKVKSVSGSIKLSGEFGSLDVNTTSGEINAVGCKVEGDLVANSVSGGIVITGAQAGGQIKANSTSGGINATGVSAKRAELSSVSGGLDLAGSVERAGMYTTSGSLRCEAGKELIDLDATSVSGSLTLTVPDRSFTAQFGKVSGSFSCSFPTTQNGSEYRYTGSSSDTASFRMNTTSGSFRIQQS